MADPYAAAAARHGTGFGSAPVKLGGVWYTRSGRQLRPEGQHWWDIQLRLGVTDGSGHINHELAGAARQARSAPTRAGRVAGGKRLGAYAKAQQEALDRPGREFLMSLTPPGAAYQAYRSGTHGHYTDAAISAMGIFGVGKAAKALKAARDVAEAERVVAPEKEVARAFQSAKRTVTATERARSVELGKRTAKMNPAFEAAGSGRAGHYAARGQLKGELPKVPFNKLKGISDDTLDQIINVVHAHPTLQPLEKNDLEAAIINAAAGKAPRRFEIALAERAFGKARARQFANVGWWRRELGKWALDAANIPRTIMSSGDLSLNLRQTLLAFVTYPPAVLKTLGPQVKAAFSESYFRREMEKLASDPHVLEAKHAGGHFTDLGDPWSREEYFSSSLAEKLTGGKYSPVRGSSRAFTLGGNLVRRNFYRWLVESERAAGRPVTEHLRQHAALFADIATGQGRLGKLAPAGPIANVMFFAPKLAASRIEGVLLPLMPGLHPAIRMKAIRGLATFLVTGLGILEAARLAGAEIGGDPTSADFGKIKIGDTRYDVWGGHQQYARLAYQMATGRITSTTTGKSMRLKGGFGGLSQWDIGTRFLRSKESPLFSFVHDLMAHETFLGQPFNLQTAVTDRMQPLLFQDAHAIQKHTGSWPGAAAAYGIGAFGVGVQNYPPKKAKGRGRSKGYSDPFGNLNDSSGSYSDPFANLSAP